MKALLLSILACLCLGLAIYGFCKLDWTVSNPAHRIHYIHIVR